MVEASGLTRKDAMNLFIFGLGYSALHFVRHHRNGFVRIAGTVRSVEKRDALRREGIEAYVFDGEEIEDGLEEALLQSDDIIVSVAPGDGGDPVLARFAETMASSALAQRIVYLSTVGVYGDHGGDWVDEASPLHPVSARSRRRVEAEEAWRDFATAQRRDLHVLRLAGIYGPGRNAIENLRAGKARRIVKPGQVFNRIHVEDIARAIHACLLRPVSGERAIWNVADDEPAPPQDVVAFAARELDMDPPPEIAFEDAQMTPMARSFYGENKRVSNRALKQDLGVELAYPTYREGVAALAVEAADAAPVSAK